MFSISDKVTYIYECEMLVISHNMVAIKKASGCQLKYHLVGMIALGNMAVIISNQLGKKYILLDMLYIYLNF